MTDFINDSTFYKTTEEYYKKKEEWMLLCMEQQAEEEQKERMSFGSEHLMNFRCVMVTTGIPKDVMAEVTYKTELFKLDKHMQEWLNENKDHDVKAQRKYVDNIIQQKKKLVDDFGEKETKRGKEWWSKYYIARKPFFNHLSDKEIDYIAERIDPSDARLISEGNISMCRCICWKGPIHATRKWPYMERTLASSRSCATGCFPQKKRAKRSCGKVQELMYNFLVKPLQTQDKLVRTCEEESCVNPYHMIMCQKGSRKRKR